MTELHDEFLNILCDGDGHYGVDQEWYPQLFQRQAGCGASSFANALIYGMRSGLIQPGLAEPPCKKDVLKIMQQTWRHLTPGMMGLHTTAAYCQGAKGYADDAGVVINLKSLDIPRKNRPDTALIFDFIREGLEAGMPVAFLNLSRGAIKPLESWHWITIVGINDAGTVTAADNGRKISLDIGMWHKTSRIGGGFVSHYATSD